MNKGMSTGKGIFASVALVIGAFVAIPTALYQWAKWDKPKGMTDAEYFGREAQKTVVDGAKGATSDITAESVGNVAENVTDATIRGASEATAGIGRAIKKNFPKEVEAVANVFGSSSSGPLVTPTPVQVTPANVPAAGVPAHWSKFLRETFPGKCVQGKTAAKAVGYEMNQEDMRFVCPDEPAPK